MEEFKSIVTDDDLTADPTPNFTSINKRYLNFLIDLFVILFSFIVAIYFIILFLKITIQINYLLIGLIIYYFLYYFIFELATSKTPGKIFTSTRVVHVKDRRPTIIHIFVRSISRFIPFDIFSYLTSGYPKGLHDRFSGTVTTDQKYNKIRKTNTFKNIILIVFETVIFFLISISVFMVFRFVVYNLMPDFRAFYKIPAMINQEIANLAQVDPVNTSYSDPDYGIQVIYPDNWVRLGNFDDQRQPAVLLIRSKKALIKINKPIRPYSARSPGFDEAQNYSEMSETAKIINKDVFQINGQNFYRFVIQDNSGGEKMTMMNMVCFAKGLVYVFTYAGYEEDYEKYLQEVIGIFTSIEIK